MPDTNHAALAETIRQTVEWVKTWNDKPAAPKPVTFSAARRRFERKEGTKIIAMTKRWRDSYGPYAISDNNVLTAWGDIDAVNDWCREAGVLAHNEFVAETA